MGEGDQHDAASPADASAKGPTPLRAVDGPLGPAEPPRTTRLRREFKGLTVADLHCAELVERLPGRVRTALRHLQRGDLAGADRVLPGEFAPVLAGPWQQHRARRRRMLMTALILLLLATTVAIYW
jgi:hypothetical protein